jgi:hypothetical protein
MIKVLRLRKIGMPQDFSRGSRTRAMGRAILLYYAKKIVA